MCGLALEKTRRGWVGETTISTLKRVDDGLKTWDREHGEGKYASPLFNSQVQWYGSVEQFQRWGLFLDDLFNSAHEPSSRYQFCS
jgi:hypothetical protein